MGFNAHGGSSPPFGTSLTAYLISTSKHAVVSASMRETRPSRPHVPDMCPRSATRCHMTQRGTASTGPRPGQLECSLCAAGVGAVAGVRDAILFRRRSGLVGGPCYPYDRLARVSPCPLVVQPFDRISLVAWEQMLVATTHLFGLVSHEVIDHSVVHAGAREVAAEAVP